MGKIMDRYLISSDLKTSDRVWDAFVKIANTSSRNEKIELLTKARDSANSLFTFALKMIFDSTINFGIVLRVSEWSEFAQSNKTGTFDMEIIEFLKNLANGKYARKEAVNEFKRFANTLSYGSVRLLVAIINKDVAAGINSSTINKVFKDLIPTFPYMRCSLPNKVDLKSMEWKVGVVAQEKADGMFVNINVLSDNIIMLSRQGTVIPTDKFPREIEHMKIVLPFGYQVHGEMLVRDPNGRIAPREIGNGIINSVCKGGEFPNGWTPLFRVWDAVPLNMVKPKGTYTEPYIRRFESLSNRIKKSIFRYNHETNELITCVELIETKIVHNRAEAIAFYSNMVASGKEGAILKNPSAIWRDGTSKEQVKLKLECDCELRIVGFEEGDGKYIGMLGSVVCQSQDGLLETNVSGFSDAMRKTIWNNREDYLDRIITVRFNDIMQKPGVKASLFLPRFVEIRDDKTEADTLTKILETKAKAIDVK